MSDCLKPSDVAENLQVSEDTVLRMIRRGDMPYIDIGTSKKKMYRIPKEAFENWKLKNTKGNKRLSA